MNTINEIAGLVARLQNENIALKHYNERQVKSQQESIDEMLADFLQILDKFDWAQETIRERGLDQSQISTKAISRMLEAKKKTLELLEKYGVQRITFPDGIYDENTCIVVGREKDATKKPGTVLSVVKDGFVRDGRVLRSAEVIVAK